ncbi:hypothetical protein G5V58_14175 [Nocardioides anomalus]|uniref:Uncharacterized protein n=1 Tax=Nocardioides anomalus TaxID=2712223 RepID=A0A6G6WEK2_9ACTN|nr:hypothetical protein [Nocardioides anomalus]QIG43758.1 hypothetical protein G5V58_14175 [Nocardioides anomalus]
MTAQILGFGEEVDVALSFGIGALALVILLALMAALVAFGGGREHS